MAQNTKNQKAKQTKQQTKKNVQDKSTQQKKKAAAGKSCSSCGCKWFLGSIVLLVMITAVLKYDTYTNGKGVFAESATGHLLKNAGLLPHVEKVYVVVMTYTARAFKWVEARMPGYVEPLGGLVIDMFLTVYNATCNLFGIIRDYAVSKWPVVSGALDEYIPGLPKKLENASAATGAFISDSIGRITQFLKVNVFVGSLSPENINKAFNSTQNAIVKYLENLSAEMDAWAKRK